MILHKYEMVIDISKEAGVPRLYIINSWVSVAKNLFKVGEVIPTEEKMILGKIVHIKCEEIEVKDDNDD